MPGGRLTDDERRQIAVGLTGKLGYTEIGRRLGRPASTIMREVTRNGGPDGYRAEHAHEATRQRARRPRRAEPPAPPVPDDVQEFTESFVALLEQQGLPRMASRVLAALYTAEAGCLTAVELARQLQVSPASVSQAVAFLDRQGLLTRTRVPGGRRERYEIDDQMWLRTTLAAMRMNEALVDISRRGAALFGSATPAGVRFDTSAGFLHTVNRCLQQGIEEWRLGLGGLG
jgi:predicted transcriptional regulator